MDVPLCSEAVLKMMPKSVLPHQFTVLEQEILEMQYLTIFFFLMVPSEQVGAFGICSLKEVWVATQTLGPAVMRDVNRFHDVLFPG